MDNDGVNSDGVMAYLNWTDITIVANNSNKIYANSDSSYMFYAYNSLSTINNLSMLDISTAIDLSSSFRSTNLETLDLSEFSTMNAMTMNSMFNGNSNLRCLNLTGFDTSKVTDMSKMFSFSSNLCSIVGINNFDVSNVNGIGDMFNAICYVDTNTVSDDFILNLGGWDTSNVQNMETMFLHTGRTSLNWSIGDISGWDTSEVRYMNNMFHCAAQGITNLTLGDISKWNTSNVSNMNSMFYGFPAFTTGIVDLSKWNVNNVTNYTYFDLSDNGTRIPPNWVN